MSQKKVCAQTRAAVILERNGDLEAGSTFSEAGKMSPMRPLRPKVQRRKSEKPILEWLICIYS